MDKGKVYAGLAIMVGLIVLGCMFPRAVKEFRSFERTVSVKGLCEKEVNADKAIWPLSYKVMSDDLTDLYSQMEKSNDAILTFLKAGGIAEDEITVNVPSISDKYAQEYGDNDRRFRYVASTTITVCTGNVDKVLQLMRDQISLTKSGISFYSDWETRPEFSFEGLNDIKPEMIEEATKNARESALKFAKDSDSKLGKIKDASQGTFSIENRDSNTPHIKKVRVVTYVTYYLKR